MIEIRDPLHGAILLDEAEAVVVDHPFVQRLRGIKQMGFCELPFPGAVHSRYAHSLGAMELAGRAFDQVFREDPFAPGKRAMYRQLVRLAALGHDLGHSPFSHCTEFAMPALRSLNIQAYDPKEVSHRLDRTASHEDYTITILTQSSLAESIARHFPFSGQHVAALVSREVQVPDDLFWDQGLDYRRVLSQLISSELDVDRLDYLARDSYYSGARYGQIDAPWLLGSLGFHTADGHPSLTLDHRAIYAFDDFILSRYHMFVMVYFHHKSVVYEEMLRRHFSSGACTYRFPSDPEAYLEMDDVHLHGYLRGAHDDWARRIVARRPYRRALERHGTAAQVNLSSQEERLKNAGIEYLATSSIGKLSQYSGPGRKRHRAPPIYVVRRLPGSGEELLLLERATSVFDRYKEEHHIARLYVAENRLEEAQKVVKEER